jgi:hypothetical protein
MPPGPRFCLRDSSGRHRRGRVDVTHIKRTLTAGRNAMDLPLEDFTLFGLDFQWWTPIVVGACAVYVAWLWKIGQFSQLFRAGETRGRPGRGGHL